VFTAFVDGTGGVTLGQFANFFGQSILRDSLFNSLVVSMGNVFFASLIAVPLAYLTVRFEFRGALLIQTLGLLPLIMPPFVGAMEQSAMNRGARGFRLFRRVIFPLEMPGFLVGAALVFVKVFDDLGTPLVMGVTNMLAPQAYLRITSIGIDEPQGYVISVLMIALVLFVVLAPHLGILLMSFVKAWSFSVLPESFTFEHHASVFENSRQMIGNTLLYCVLSANIDIVIGTVIAYLVLRTTLPTRRWLDYLASVALAVPDLVLATGYLRFFKVLTLPFTETQVVASWVLIMMAYAVRRLPYALRSCVAAMQQVHLSLEEAAQSLGATRWRTVRRVMVLFGGRNARWVCHQFHHSGG
jgi:iron(III) transport system permease protein